MINGHKWFTSGAHGARFAIVIAKTDPDAEIAQARNSAFIVPTDSEGFDMVRDVQTMGKGGGHAEIRYNNVRVPRENMLGERGGGHKLGQVRLGPARLAHCMRWIGQIETALEMLIERAQNRYAHGFTLVRKARHSVDDVGKRIGSLRSQANGAALRVQNRKRHGLSFRDVDGQAPRSEHVVEGHGPCVASPRCTRLLE